MPPVATFSNNTYATMFFASLKRLRIADGNAQIPLLLFADLHVCAAFMVRFVDGNRVNLIAWKHLLHDFLRRLRIRLDIEEIIAAVFQFASTERIKRNHGKILRNKLRQRRRLAAVMRQFETLHGDRRTGRTLFGDGGYELM